MATEIKFNSQPATTIEQSERLIALGLRKETADMTHHYLNSIDSYELKAIEFSRIMHLQELVNKKPLLRKSGDDLYAKDIPAWSLHRLWEILPKSFWYDNGVEKKYHPIIEYDFVNYVTIDGMELFDLNYQKDVWESMLDCIEWLIKEGYFNKEYLV